MKPNNKPDDARFTTPKGVARYPRLTTPDTKWRPEGTFKVSVFLNDPDGIQACEEAIEPVLLAAQALAEGSGRPQIELGTTPLREVEGGFEFVAKTSASFTAADGQVVRKTVPIFDRHTNPWPTDTIVGGGSTVRVSVTLRPFTKPSTERKNTTLYGVAAYLNGVQVFEHRAPGADASALGFSADPLEEGPAGDQGGDY